MATGLTPLIPSDVSIKQERNFIEMQMIICKVGQKILSAYLLKKVNEIAPGVSIDQFLASNKALLTTVKRYFPLDANNHPLPTNIQDWDVSMITLVLIKSRILSNTEIKDIDFIRTTRNELHHLAKPAVTNVVFTRFRTEFDGFLKRSFMYLRNKELEEQCKYDLEIINGRISSAVLNANENIQKEYNVLIELKNLRKEPKANIETMRRILDKIEELRLSEDAKQRLNPQEFTACKILATDCSSTLEEERCTETFLTTLKKKGFFQTAKSLIQNGVEKTKDVYGLGTFVHGEVVGYFEDFKLELNSLLKGEQIEEYLSNPSPDVQPTTDVTEEVRESIQPKSGSLQTDKAIIRDDTSLADSVDIDVSKPEIETGTMTEFTKKDIGTMAHYRDTATMTELIKKDDGTMAEHRDATSLADYLESDLLKLSVNVETGAMTEFMKKDVGTMTQYRDYTSPADSMTTDLSKPSTDFAMADFHIYTVEEALAKEPDSIINLAVQVIKTEAVQSNTTHDNTMRSYFSCLVADKTGSVWLRVYQAHERNTFKSHTSIMLRGLLRKSCEHPMWCVSTTELIYLQPVDVPQKIIEAAMKTTQPMSPQIRFLDEAVTSQTPSIAVDKLLPRDVIHEVTDPIPDSPDPDLLADVDWSEDICNSIQIDHTSPADSLETVLSEPSVNVDIEARTIPDLMKKCIGTITENRDQLDDQNETDEPLAANETLYTQTQLNELCSQDGRKIENCISCMRCDC